MGSMRLAALTLVLVACGDNIKHEANDGAVDVVADVAMPDGNPLTPPTLDGTGLCTDAACTTVAADVSTYAPRFELWADTATKQRWMRLPPATTIDTSDMDHWVFPVGTKFWKEFTRGGTRVETRYIVKLLADDSAIGAWFYAAYQWNAAQDDTMLVTAGVTDANGTQHDIPSRTDCRRCHEGLQPSRILGFGAIQLDFTAPTGRLDLADLIAAGALSAPPAGASPYFPLPGTAVDQAALGYLHANCGHCHNPTSDTFSVTPTDVRLRTAMLATVTGTPTYATTVGVDAAVPFFENGMNYTKIIIASEPVNSGLIVRMNSMNAIRRMPTIASEIVDPAGQTALVAWINSL